MNPVMGVISIAGYLFIASCATPTDTLMAQYHEQERVIAYRVWQQACADAGGTVYINKPFRPCARTDCVPHRLDWSHDRKNNHAQCVKIQ